MLRAGPYPLTLVLARSLGCVHTELTIGFVTLGGLFVFADPEEPRAESYAVLESPPAIAARAAEEIVDSIGRDADPGGVLTVA